MYPKRWHRVLPFCSGLLLAVTAGLTRAEPAQTPLYLSVIPGKPNIMLMVDTSGSMGTTVSSDPQRRTRIAVAKEAATNLVTQLTPASGAQPTVRLGLAAYNSGKGGKLLFPLADLDQTQANSIKGKIAQFAASGVTPLATTLSDIGYYFATNGTVDANNKTSGSLVLHPGQSNQVSKTVTEVFTKTDNSDMLLGFDPVTTVSTHKLCTVTQNQAITPASAPAGYSSGCGGSFIVPGGANDATSAQTSTPIQLIMVDNVPTICTNQSTGYACTDQNNFGVGSGIPECPTCNDNTGTTESIVYDYLPTSSVAIGSRSRIRAYESPPAGLTISFSTTTPGVCKLEASYSDTRPCAANDDDCRLRGLANGTCRLCTTFNGTNPVTCAWSANGATCYSSGQQSCANWNNSSCNSTSDTWDVWNHTGTDGRQKSCASEGAGYQWCNNWSSWSNSCRDNPPVAACSKISTNNCLCMDAPQCVGQAVGYNWFDPWNHAGTDALGNSCASNGDLWCNSASYGCNTYGDNCAKVCDVDRIKTCPALATDAITGQSCTPGDDYCTQFDSSTYQWNVGNGRDAFNNKCSNEGEGYHWCTAKSGSTCTAYTVCAKVCKSNKVKTCAALPTDDFTGQTCITGQPYCKDFRSNNSSYWDWNHSDSSGNSVADALGTYCSSEGQVWCQTRNPTKTCNAYGSNCSRAFGICDSITPNTCNCTVGAGTACVVDTQDITVGTGVGSNTTVTNNGGTGGTLGTNALCFQDNKYYRVQYNGNADVSNVYTGAQWNWFLNQPGFTDGSFELPPNTTTSCTDVVNTNNCPTCPIQEFCQKSFAILISDGLPNGDRTVSDLLKDYTGDCAAGLCDAASNSTQMPGVSSPLQSTGTSCNKTGGRYYLSCKNGGKVGRAYESTGSDYLDDVAKALYEIDLRPDLRVASEPNNAKNNVITYTIGFADPNLSNNSILNDAARLGGGKFFYAGDAVELATALNSVLSDISSQIGSSASVATNSTQVGSDALVYQAKFDSGGWFGNLNAFSIVSDPDADDYGKLNTTPVWDAGLLVPAAADRTILTYTGSVGVSFTCANLSTTQKAELGITNCSDTSSQGVWLVDYIRGDKTHEIVNGKRRFNGDTETRTTGTSAVFRNRTRLDPITMYALGPDPWRLGDIVNSNPVYVAAENFGYSRLDGTEGSTYSTFLIATKGTSENPVRRSMVYVGANDGMLHGFDASPSGTTAGKEIMAYIPNAVYSKFVDFAKPSYDHQYFVDGSPTVGDAYFGNAWHSVLVGTTGAGAKAVFAIDVTDPASFSGGNVLWEVSNTSSPTASDVTTNTSTKRGFTSNLGYTIGQASVVRMYDGSWVALVANGFYSLDNRAILYILDIHDGHIIRAIEATNSSEDDFTSTNGLATPFPADINGDAIVDYIYAGDLRGNMWKFDVTSTNSADWAVAKSGAPLYTACDQNMTLPCSEAHRQPITTRPYVGPSLSPNSFMVYFGTGKYFEDSDNNFDSPQTQTFYGILDNADVAVPSSGTKTRDSLAGQSVTDTITSPSGAYQLRLTSNNSCVHDGWYMDLPTSGERMVSFPLLRDQKVPEKGRIIFTTLIPIRSTDVGSCSVASNGTGWLMELSAMCGIPVNPAAWDINNDGIIDSSDLIGNVSPSGVKSSVGIPTTPGVVELDNTREKKYVTGSSGKIEDFTESRHSGTDDESLNPGGGGGDSVASPGGNDPDRQSWKQIY
ncbi:hypothetical protein TI04_06385 [Achromatium sp. WMS2]|nr:hypothetical protein TI04_06385 [Achromatium sp. WMS2]